MSTLPEDLPPEPEDPHSPGETAKPRQPEPWPEPPLPPDARHVEIRPSAEDPEIPGNLLRDDSSRGADTAEEAEDPVREAEGFNSGAGRAQGEGLSAPDVEEFPRTDQAAPGELPPFESFARPEFHWPTRIPHLGHVLLLVLLLMVGLAGDFVAIPIALHYHLFGVTSTQDAMTDIHYTLGSEGILYLITFAGCVLVFPLLWHKGFLQGISWHYETAKRLSPYLVGAAFVCFLLALVNGWLMPGPQNAPIDKMFRVPGAAWLLFGFGITFAPFFEEMVFRGFLLPALCTACDWIGERIKGESPRRLAGDGLPRWSLPAMVIGSVCTSLPFAGMHAAQTGYSLGPFLLLIGVSLVLCGARLVTRSLAASVLIHACYNFMLFALMLFGTGGFRHLENM